MRRVLRQLPVYWYRIRRMRRLAPVHNRDLVTRMDLSAADSSLYADLDGE